MKYRPMQRIKTMNDDMIDEEAQELEVGLEDLLCSLGETGTNDPLVDETNRRLANRELIWNGEVDENTIGLSFFIQKWNDEDIGIPIEERKPIKFYINSDGGALITAMHLMDMISISKTPVWTIGMGKVHSAGGLLLMAGHRRLVFESTTCLIHDGYISSSGVAGKIADGLEFQNRLEKRVKNFVISHTNITSKVYEKNYRRDWFLFSDEMIDYGIADEIITDIDVLA